MGMASEHLGSSPNFRLPINPVLGKALNPCEHHSFLACETRGPVQLTYRADQGPKTLGVHHKGPQSNPQAQSFGMEKGVRGQAHVGTKWGGLKLIIRGQ